MNIPKVTLAPVKGTSYTIHDGVLVVGQWTARCSVVSMRRQAWHVLPNNLTTTCRRCLSKRDERTPRQDVAAIAHELLSAADAPVLDVERIGDLFKRLATVYSQIANQEGR